MFEKPSTDVPWSPKAQEALDAAVEQMPGPKIFAGQIRKRLQSAAEDAARAAGHTDVQPEDLMSGLLAMLPPPLRETIEKRMSEGPDGLKKLQDDLKNMNAP